MTVTDTGRPEMTTTTHTAEIPLRLIGAWFPRVGTRVRMHAGQPLRRVTEIEEFAEVRRLWVDGGDYIDVGRQATIFVPAADDGGPMD